MKLDFNVKSDDMILCVKSSDGSSVNFGSSYSIGKLYKANVEGYNEVSLSNDSVYLYGAYGAKFVPVSKAMGILFSLENI